MLAALNQDETAARVTVPATLAVSRAGSWRARYTLAAAIIAFAIVGYVWVIITLLVFVPQIQSAS